MAVNGIHFHIDSATLGCTVGDLWIPIPHDGLADLAPDVCGVLRRHVGPQDSAQSICHLYGVTAPTWEAVVARAIDVAMAEAVAEAEAQQKAVTALAAWREGAARYCAGDTRYSTRGSDSALFPAAEAGGGYLPAPKEVTDAELDAVKRETQRRDLAYAAEQIARAAEREKESAAQQARIVAARLAWLREYGTEDQVERFEARVLPLQELQALVRDVLLSPQADAWSLYRPRTREDILHDDDCHQDDDAWRVQWTVEDASTAPLTADQWRTLKAIRTAMAPQANVTVRRHTAKLSCDCPDPSWLAVRVLIELPELDLRVQRQFEL